ncbi:MAG: YchJ family protein [Spirochaetaceae bacterium]|nr:YchJ family protein [Spirochaetaceae bacterium]
MSVCPCGSEKEYQSCCAIYIEKGIKAPTAEALMRARYSAYSLGKVDFIMESHIPSDRENLSKEDIESWSKESQWMGLEILSTSKGKEKDSKGTVEFKANYMQDRARYTHHELALFEKEGDSWYFVDGQIQNKPLVRETAKVGRNDPCPCGSGKKYKKCCG